MGQLARRLFRISPEETAPERRGFRWRDGAEKVLGPIGPAFLHGYHAALDDHRPRSLARSLEGVAPEHRGFATEGIAMALAILDALQPWRRSRLRAYLDGPGKAFVYLVYVGVGWAMARIPRPLRPRLASFDPVLRWLALDGYGFHQGYFYAAEAVRAGRVPGSVRGYARRVFDQGLGRSLWFVEGTDPGGVAAAVEALPGSRHPDLWSGVGLACAYAGGADAAGIRHLLKAAGPCAPAFGQGVAFAAKARVRAGNVTAATERACRRVWGLPASAVAALTDAVRGELPSAASGVPAFEIWRQRIQRRFVIEVAA